MRKWTLSVFLLRILPVLCAGLVLISCEIVPTAALTHDNPVDPESASPDAVTFTVSFESNGGSAVAQQTVAEGGLVSKPADPTKDGQNFAGWYADAALGTAWDFLTDTVSADLTLYAKWSDKPVYEVSFQTGGGSAVGSQSVVEGETATKPDDPTWTGYVFKGWYREAACATLWDFNNDRITTNVVIYAKWRGIECTVTLDMQTGTGGTASVTATFGSPMPTATAPTLAHSTFGGYYSQTNGAGTMYYAPDMTGARSWDLTSDTTLYAGWTADTFSVTYHAGTGSTSGSVPADGNAYEYNETAAALGNTGGLVGPLIQDGICQRFLGWSTSASGTTVEYAAAATFPVTANVDLYAVYTTTATVVGKVGPAGGFVFYDAGSILTWGRYLEAAPPSATSGIWKWGTDGTSVSTGTVIGTGASNTAAIVTAYGTGITYAARTCSDLSYGGYSDWFLPSHLEMDSIYANLYTATPSIGGYSSNYYWSSSDYNANFAYLVSFSDGSHWTNSNKSNNYLVIAVRAF